MTIVRDFERLYQTEDDPWQIGDADTPRYNTYLELLRPHAKGAVLDIGCGFGALLARLAGDGIALEGIEISETAVVKGRQRFPFITFHSGNAARIADVAGIQDRKFDLIICSDVIYYITEREQSELLAWINNHLSAEGVAFVAAWCPGGNYLLPDELVESVGANIVPMRIERFPDSDHVVILGRKRQRFASITIDYETWHPIPEGKTIDWEKDVFAPTERLFALFERADVSATFFAEMGEYFWLLENEPQLAQRMADQWREAVSRGHDVQLHLHPCWLPETGATHKDGSWNWDWSKSKAADYPGNLSELIGRCKAEIEKQVQQIQPGYTVTCFRAGAYQAQPFAALAEALLANGILCDSSVFPYGKSDERGFNYGTPYSTHQPYFADLLDPQLKALPAEEKLLELPIFTPEHGRRWFIDNNEADTFAKRLMEYERRRFKLRTRTLGRALKKVRRYFTEAYFLVEKRHVIVNKLLPRKLAYSLIAPTNPRPFGSLYYVAIGHTKADLNYGVLERDIRYLKSRSNVEFVTLSEMARTAIAEIEVDRRQDRTAEMEYQVQRETTAILGDKRNAPQSHYLQEMIPLDGVDVLDFGCGAGYWCDRISKLYPWMAVTGIDAGAEFISKARRLYESERIKFEIGDFASLAYADGSFDCVYADNTLEHGFDLDAALNEIYRVLREGGALVAALPLDGLNPDEVCDNHTWKTVKSQALQRLARAGFTSIEAVEVDTYKQLGMPPYMPAMDSMLYVRAWKFCDDDRWQRAAKAMRWIYERVEPTKANLSEDAKQIIADGYAYCIGYTVALGQLLKREGYDVTWITMRAEDHECGRGARMIDSHEVLEVAIDGERRVFDPMANTYFHCSLDALIATPEKADAFAYSDSRSLERGYHLYNTAYWYRRVIAVSRRRNIHWPSIIWKKYKKNKI